MISLLLDGVQLGFEEVQGVGGQPVKILVVTDEKSGIQVRLPLEPEAARAIAAHLDGRPPIHVVRTLPPDSPPQNSA